jgi:hypothetical protein
LIFHELLTNLLPLYVIIAIGFAAGRLFDIDRRAIADLILFVLMPVTIFGFVVQTELRPEYALLPFIFFGLLLFMSASALFAGRRMWRDNTPNLFALCSAMPNAGYFGLPLVALLFDVRWVGVYSLMLLGGVFFEATFGYYIAARGNFDVRQSLGKLVRFPVIYAVIVAIIANLAGYEPQEQALKYWEYFRGGYIVTGMMIVGLALAKTEKLDFGGGRFFALVFTWKFLFWPLVALMLVLFDRIVSGIMQEEVHRLLLLLSILPSAANITAFAAQLDLSPDKAATAVVGGTLFALAYIPAVFCIFGI